MGVSRIAIVDDDPAFSRMLGLFCKTEGVECLALDGGEGSLEQLAAAQPDLIIVDLWLDREGGGLELIRAIRQSPGLQASRVIVCSGAEQDLRRHADEFAALGCRILPKPFDLEELHQEFS